MQIKDCIPLENRRPLIFGTEDEHIQSAYERMKSESVHHLAVVKDGSLTGLVDHDSILNAVMLSPQNFNSLELKDLMKTQFATLDESSSLEDVLLGFQDNNIKALPYFAGGECVTLITQTDMLQALNLILLGHQSKLQSAEAKGELFMANPLVQRIMSTLSDVGI